MHDSVKDGSDGIMTGAPGAKSITIWLKHTFPFWFKPHFGKGLFAAVKHGEDTKRSAFILLAGLGGGWASPFGFSRTSGESGVPEQVVVLRREI